MSEIRPQRLSSEHSVSDTWQAINTPLTGDLGRLVNPFVSIVYQDLSGEGTVQTGTLITYTPVKAELKPKLGILLELLPDDVTLRVGNYDPANRSRLDVVESSKHAGSIQSQVEAAADGTSLLVIQGELLLGGSRKMYESRILPYAEQGLASHSQLVLDHLPTIIGQ